MHSLHLCFYPLGSCTPIPDEPPYLVIMLFSVADNLGCFGNPGTLTPAIFNYSSMGIALCRQACLARNTAVALVDVASCYCLDSTLSLSAFDPNVTSGCRAPCPSNSLQACAAIGYLRAYAVGQLWWSLVFISLDLLVSNGIKREKKKK